MKKWYLLSTIAVIAIAVIIGCILFFKPEPPKQQMANEAEGRFLLRNIAIAQQAYSATRGGGGQKFFTDKIEELQPYASQKTIGAIKTINHPGQQWGGYFLIIHENPKGDAFQNNYIAIAYPAEGFNGKTMQISKDENIIEKEK